MAQFSLSWDAYKQNICTGLSVLQQSGEFVDMTIAADGHHVKVHQMVMSLVSPYIKDLITSAQCPHPVIFLNKVSYATLCSILEYIYTGEVMIDKDNLAELVEAGRELHIRGLEDLKIEKEGQYLSPTIKTNEGQPPAKKRHFTKEGQHIINADRNIKVTIAGVQPTFKRESYISNAEDDNMDDNVDDTNDITFHDEMDMDNDTNTAMIDIKKKKEKKIGTTLQYTKSNRGALQIIVNRYIYNLIYTSKKHGGTRRWQCVDYRDKQCKAVVFTKDGVIVQRYAAHSHPFHDKRILKKVQENLVYSTLSDTDFNAGLKSQSKIQEQGNESISTSKNKNTDREDTTDAE